MIKIRSSLNSSIEFSVKKKVGNVSEILTIKIERSVVKGKPEFLNEITEEECKALKDDSSGIFMSLLKDGKFQIVQDADAQEDSENRAFSMEELDSHAASVLKEYKEGDGADLLKSSLVELREDLNEESERDVKDAVNEAKTAWESEAKTNQDAAVENAVSELKATLVKKHNSEVTSGKPKKWS